MENENKIVHFPRQVGKTAVMGGLELHAVDTQKLDRELERHLGADDEEFARQFAHWANRAAQKRRDLGPALDDALDHAFPGGAWRREGPVQVKSGRQWPPHEYAEPVTPEKLAEFDWSIRPPTTPAERNGLIWGSGLVLGSLVVLVIAAIVAGIKLAMG